jgi:hypothetical protein
VFDTKNTATEQEIPLIHSVETAREAARRLSLSNHHVIVFRSVGRQSGDTFETYEHGERTEWSYPHGIEIA